MQNVNLKVDGSILTIKVDLSKDYGPSSSGKSIIIATTSGNVTVEGDIKLGLNIYRRS